MAPSGSPPPGQPTETHPTETTGDEPAESEAASGEVPPAPYQDDEPGPAVPDDQDIETTDPGDVDEDGPAAAEVADDDDTATWRLLPSGRWVVGDEGRQPEIVPIPSPPWTRPDTVVDGAKIGDMQFRAVSVRGLSHQQTSKPRQDAYGFRITRNGDWFVGCVADGVSQGRRSEHAADIACRETTTALTEALEKQAIPEEPASWADIASSLPCQLATDLATAAILEAATSHVRATFIRQGETERVADLDANGLPLRAAAQVMATTAIVLVIATTRNQNGLLPYLVLECAGDSSALILNNGEWVALTAVKNADNEIASSAVRPLPSRANVAPQAGLLEAGEAIALITDGIGDPLGSGAGVVGQFLGERWAQPPDLLAFANQVAFFRKTFTDDRTALVVWGAPLD